MTQFTREGDCHFPHSDQSLKVTKTLPAGYHTIGFHPQRGYYFRDTAAMELPPKLYGSTVAHSERVRRTFKSRPGNTGALFVGEKGSGKSLLLRHICTELVKEGLPVILVNNAYCGEDFNQFLMSLKQPVVLAMDEFEKTYDDEDQVKILTLMDGVFPSQFLFLLTVNKVDMVNEFMKNRPGRLFYNLTFEGLEADAIVGYAQDNLKAATDSAINSILMVAQIIGKFNFDMLKALVEEMNRYDEPAHEAVRWLNIRPASAERTYFKAKWHPDQTVLAVQSGQIGKSEEEIRIDDYTSVRLHNAQTNPLSQSETLITVEYKDQEAYRVYKATPIDERGDVDNGDRRGLIRLSADDLAGMDHKTGALFYHQKKTGNRILIEKDEYSRAPDPFAWMA